MSIAVIQGNTANIDFIVTSEELADGDIPQELLEDLTSFTAVFEIYEKPTVGNPIRRVSKSIDTPDFKRGTLGKLMLTLRPEDTETLNPTSKFSYVLEIYKKTPNLERYTISRGEFILEPRVK